MADLPTYFKRLKPAQLMAETISDDSDRGAGDDKPHTGVKLSDTATVE